jgi:drug/metabolite transporter (DMT)-like permease
MPIFAIYIYREGTSVLTLLAIRFSIASVLLFGYLWLQGVKIVLTRKQIILLFTLGGILYAMQSSFYFASVQYIPASLAALLLYTYPVFVALLSLVVDKEILNRQTWLAIILSTGGLVLVLGAAPSAINLAGVLFALAAAIVYSVYIVLGNRVVQGLSPLVTSAFVSVFAAVSLSIAGLAGGKLEFATITAIAWLAIIGIILFSTILAMLTLFRGLELIGPTKASILSMVEPLVTFAFSALLFADRLTATQLAGGAAVIIGAILVIKSQAKPAEVSVAE